MKACIIAVLVGAVVAAPANMDKSMMDMDHRVPADMGALASPAMMDMAHRRPVAGVSRRQSEEIFQEAVAKCQMKLDKAEIKSLDDCVLDTLGINRRQLEAPQELLEKITQDCTDKTPGDQASIYDCVVKALRTPRDGDVVALPPGMPM